MVPPGDLGFTFADDTEPLKLKKKQQHETLLRYEFLTSSERTPSLASTENTTSITSSDICQDTGSKSLS
jgi:hypothetical protein